MAHSVKPIFLFSLPRSGSTLLQRILAKHPAIGTAAEPWILLPLMSSLNKEGVYANYDHSATVDAIKDYYQGMEGGENALKSEIREFALRLYSQRASPNAYYFLDKTPRYHLIVDQILETFPDARFIFLWRNPLSIVSSMLNTWHRDKWYLYFFKVDLFDGLERLINAYSAHNERVISVNYESLLLSPEETCNSICSYLDVPFLQEMIEDFNSVTLEGDMGDPTGVKAYKSISSKPLQKWKKTIKNPLRKRWCNSYLKWLGEERLSTMGYNLNDLQSELDSIPFSLSGLHSDLYLSLYGELYQFLELRLFQDKMRNLSNKRHKHNHPHL